MSVTDLSAAALREMLHYDPKTGSFMWIGKVYGRAAPGKEAGSLGSKGYWRITLFGKTYKRSRLAWLYMRGAWPLVEVDHKDGNPANDRWRNLRAATRLQNARNRTKKVPASGFVGVSAHKGRWRALVKIDGKTRHLGIFDTPEQAHQAWRACTVPRHGKFFSKRTKEAC